MKYRWFHYLIPILLIVLSAAAVQVALKDPGRTVSDQSESGQASADRVTLGRDYYVFVKVVEVAASDESGSAWDSTNDSGPDLFAEINWRGQRVFRSSTRADSLLAKWSAAEIDLRQMALTGQKASLEGLVQAARINVVARESITIAVFDEDLLGSVLAGGELVGTFDVPTEELMLGEQVFLNPTKAIVRVVLETVSMDSSPEVFK